MRHHVIHPTLDESGLTHGDRAAERVASFLGSWKFIGIQTLIIILWIVANAVAVFGLHWDPYPFILLNLLFSTQAAYAAPILQLASNQGSRKDRTRDQYDFEHNVESLALLKAIHADQHGEDCVCYQPAAHRT